VTSAAQNGFLQAALENGERGSGGRHLRIWPYLFTPSTVSTAFMTST